MPKIFAKQTALWALSDGGVYSQLINYLGLVYGSWETENGDRAERQIEREAGKLRANNNTFVSPKIKPDLLPIATLVSLINAATAVQARSLEVIRYPAFLTIADADYNKNVPQYMPNSRVPELDQNGDPVLDGNGDPVITKIKWNTYKDFNHEHRDIGDGFKYIPLNSNNKGRECAGSLIVRLIEDGYDVKQMDSYPTVPE